ncbi:hypothetical protein ACTHPH_24005 [Paenibacillus pasadenensis]|uniref:hypothetical protein n=1 Tax=Paenibacillus pasadenensis TaxID=217090 RepID=UPI000FDA8878|nr:hypothetical protein [Paenibacillus pasadenensis]
MTSRWDTQGRSVELAEMLNINSEIARTLNISVPAGATAIAIAATPVVDFRRIWAYAVCKTAEPHNMTLRIEYAHTSGSSGMYPNAAAGTSVAVTSMNRVNIPQTDLPCTVVYVTLTNQDATAHSYDVVLGGVK